LAVDVTEIAQAAQKRLRVRVALGCAVDQYPKARAQRGLLRAGWERPRCCCAAEQRDEVVV
jgi:hypothetical protein